MRGRGRKGGFSYRDSPDHLRHKVSSTYRGSHSTHDDRDNSLPCTTQPTPTPITAASAALPCPVPSAALAHPVPSAALPRPVPSAGNVFVGSSSSSVSTTCAGGATAPDSGTLTSSMDSFALASGCERPQIQLLNGALHPSDVCARRITSIFKERMDENGYCWKNVSMETKEFYWNEFQKHFVWDELISSDIKMAWLHKAAERYKALMCRLRKGKEKNMHMSDSAWQIWNEAWNSPEFKARSLRFTANRLTETGGPGSGISRHTGGSISHTRHAERLRSRLGRDPLPFELFKVTHTRKGTSTLVDARAQAIQDRYLELVEQSSETQEGSSEPPIVDETSLYYQAVGGEKKRRVYGVGSQTSVFYPHSSQRLPTGTVPEAVETEFTKMRETISQLQDGNQQLQDSNQELRQSLTAIVEERDQYREQMMSQMQDMMRHFEARLDQRSQAATQDSQPTSDDHDDHLDDL